MCDLCVVFARNEYIFLCKRKVRSLIQQDQIRRIAHNFFLLAVFINFLNEKVKIFSLLIELLAIFLHTEKGSVCKR